jgi:hypothetical protein
MQLFTVRLASGALVLLLVVVGLAACDDTHAAGQGAPASASPAQAQAASKATEAERVAAQAAEKAAEETFPYLEALAAIVDATRADGAPTPDCPKLGQELGRFAQDKEAAIAKLRTAGGGKSAVERALKKKFGDKYEALFDKILEATEVQCSADQGVLDAARKLDL